MRRAANMSRVLPDGHPPPPRGLPGPLVPGARGLRHNDGVNRLVVRFAREGVAAVTGWRGEVNVPGLTQVRPDLLVQVRDGALGPGTHYIEFERYSVMPSLVERKLGPYRRMAAISRPLPLLVVTETARGR